MNRISSILCGATLGLVGIFGLTSPASANTIPSVDVTADLPPSVSVPAGQCTNVPSTYTNLGHEDAPVVDLAVTAGSRHGRIVNSSWISMSRVETSLISLEVGETYSHTTQVCAQDAPRGEVIVVTASAVPYGEDANWLNNADVMFIVVT